MRSQAVHRSGIVVHSHAFALAAPCEAIVNIPQKTRTERLGLHRALTFADGFEQLLRRTHKIAEASVEDLDQSAPQLVLLAQLCDLIEVYHRDVHMCQALLHT